MLEYKRSAAALERPCGAFHGNIARRAFNIRHCAQHLTLAGGLQVAVKLLVNGHATHRSSLCLFRLALRDDFHVEAARRMFHSMRTVFSSAPNRRISHARLIRVVLSISGTSWGGISDFASYFDVYCQYQYRESRLSSSSR